MCKCKFFITIRFSILNCFTFNFFVFLWQNSDPFNHSELMSCCLMTQSTYLSAQVIPRGTLSGLIYADGNQCVLIGRFIRLWATFLNLWQQLIGPNCPHSLAILVKVSKCLIFLVISFLDNFYRHLAIFSDHTDGNMLLWTRY